MRKIYFLIGMVCLSISLKSCSNDDDFQQEIENQSKYKKELQIIEKSTLSNTTNSKSDHADVQEAVNKKGNK